MDDATVDFVSPTRPAHVPPERVLDFDIYAAPPAGGDFHAFWRRFQDQAAHGVVWTPRNGGHWIATRAEVVSTVFQDAARFSSSRIAVPAIPGEQPLSGAVGKDPPAHGDFRVVLNTALSPRATKALEPVIRASAAALFDAIAPRGRCEFISEVADVLPLNVFLNMAALPLEHRKMLSVWTGDIVRWADEAARDAAFVSLVAYLEPILRERRGGGGDDVLTQLADTTIDGEPISHEEALGAARHLLIAGLDTVASVLAFVMDRLARDAELRRRLVQDPAAIPKAAGEFLRRFPIVVMSRSVTQDTELDGVGLKRDDMISAPTMLFNLDPSMFPDPMALDIDRPAGKLLTFGDGAHRCPGSSLGRMELVIVLEEWLKRVPDFAIEEDTGRILGGVVATMDQLTLRWTPTA